MFYFGIKSIVFYVTLKNSAVLCTFKRAEITVMAKTNHILTLLLSKVSLASLYFLSPNAHLCFFLFSPVTGRGFVNRIKMVFFFHVLLEDLS